MRLKPGAARPKPKALHANPMRKMALDVGRRLEILGVDPITIIALIAVGDVVSAGYMTKKEYEADAEVVESHGLKVVLNVSGRQKALQYITPRMRLDAAECLAQYVWPKRAAVTHANPDGSAVGKVITFRLPDNGRVPPPPGSVT